MYVSEAVVLAFAVCFGCVLIGEGLETFNRDKQQNHQSGLGIYDGSDAKITKHNYMVGILVNDSFYCAGTILSSSWVITLADCVKGVAVDELAVVANSTDGSTGDQYSVATLVLHPNYGLTTLDYDYALLQVSGGFTLSNYTNVAKIPKKQTKDDVVMNVVGYGNTAGSTERLLHVGRMTWLSKTSCQQYYANYSVTWTERMGCAYSEGETTLCGGDYGDPFLRNEVFFGFFIAAAKEGFCTATALPVILADIFPVVDWITETISA